MGLKRSERPVLTGGLRFLTEIHQHPLLTIFCPLYQVPIWKESANCRRARGRRAATPPWFILLAPAKWSKETETAAAAVLRTTPGRRGRSYAASTAALRRHRSSGTTRRSMLLRPAASRRLATQAAIMSVQPCQSAGVFRSCGSVPAGGERIRVLVNWSKEKRLHNVQPFL